MMADITGETRIVGLVADPVGHLKGFREFNARFARLGAPVVMMPAHVRAGKLREFILGARQLSNLQGLIVSLPHKRTVIDHIDAVSTDAAEIGAVNAIRRQDDGTLFGDNFDGKGLVRAMLADRIMPEDRQVLLLGAGGAGRAIGFALAGAGAAMLGIHDLDAGRATSLADSLRDRLGPVAAVVDVPEATGFDMVVNATPLGLADDDPSPLTLSTLRSEHIVVDIVNRPETRLIAAARALDCVTQLGNAMMAAQVSEVADFLLGRS